MAETTTNLLVHLRKILAGQEILGLSDGDLAERFRVRRDDASFAALVERHGSMVFGVCRRLLGDSHDSEDAWQATFLVLARRIDAIRKPESLASWLHGVAFRIASDLRRRRTRVLAHTDDQQPARVDPAADPTWREIRAALDEELAALPERWRLPIILCHLEGKTRDEAAQALGRSVGAVRGCLERGRAVLAARLKKRGIVLSAALFATLISTEPISAALAVSTSRLAGQLAQGAALGSVLADSQILPLVQGAIRAMFYAKLKWSACIAAGLLFCTILSSVSLFALSFSGDVAAAPNEPAIEVNLGQGKPTDQRKPGDVMLPETKKAIEHGLAFLAREQGADGAWKLRADSHVGATSIAGLAFLSTGNSPDKGKYAANVRAAIAFLSKCVDDNHRGYLRNPKSSNENMYSHGFATLFLAEAYRASADKKQKQLIKPMLEGAVQLIAKAQNAKGGWRYTPRPIDGDLTVTACQMRALLAAKRAGINVPKKTLDAGFDFIASCQMKDGSFKYLPFGGVGNYPRATVALSVLSDAGAKDEVARAAIAYARGVAGDGVANLRENDANYWYARFHENRALQAIGDPDGRRYLAMQKAILPLFQDGRWSDRTLGSSYATAMAILSLAPPAANKDK